jgi:hypothetical protein
MALIVKDRVKEVTTTTGTGTITLGGASAGFRSFADIGNANTTYYCISGGSQFEVGVGTYTASGTTLSRDTVLSNSLGTTALIDFSAGSKDVFVTYPSDKAILGTTSAVASTGTGSVVLSASPTLTGTVQLPNSSFVSGTSTIGYAANVSVGQTNYLTNNTIQIGGNEADSSGGGSSAINIGADFSEVGESYANPTTTNIYGNVIFPTAAQLESVTFEKQITVSSGGSLSVLGGLTAGSSLNLLSNGNSNNNIASNQTSGSLQIGGTAQTSGVINIGGSGAATGAINLGRSIGAQTVQIGGTGNIVTVGGATGTGAITLGRSTGAQTIGIGTANNNANIINIGGAQTSTGTISIGRSTGTQTVNIATGLTTAGATKTLNLGTEGNSSSTRVVNIGSLNGNSTVNLNSSYLNFGATTFTQPPTLYDNLLSAPEGTRAFLTDYNAIPVFYADINIAGGGGTYKTPIFYDGTTWRVG